MALKLFEYINKSEFDLMVNQGYININEHPNGLGYKILNYSPMCQIEKVWNDTTTKCRGLIIDNDYNIIAKPFKKFFNYEEYDDKSIIPNDLDFEVFEKLDGSLGIMYWIGDTPFISTRGSFTSDQALHATHLLHTRYRNIWNKLDRNYTYLFEIIYPDDLHVVTYKNVNNIFLIGVLSLNDDSEDNIDNWSHIFNVTKRYNGVKDWLTIRELFNGDNREGFVVKFSNGFRLKLKYAEYFRLHVLKNNFSEKRILECLCNGDTKSIEDVLDMFDEEHQIYYNNIISKYQHMYDDILQQCLFDYHDGFDTQKEAALYFQTCKYPSVLFNMRSGKDINPPIWKYVVKELKTSE